MSDTARFMWRPITGSKTLGAIAPFNSYLHAMSRLRCALMLTLALMAGACSQNSAQTNPDLAEAVFRYQFGHNASGVQSLAGYYCIGFANDDHALTRLSDPSPAFLARFAKSVPAVEPASKCVANSARPVTDLRTGRDALFFRVGAIRCPVATRCEVDGGYYEGNESSSSDTYVVEKRGERWTVLKDVLHWIS
jgi:hypothetical protein